MNCRHHPLCPGCPEMDRSYTDQLQRKQERVIRAFSRYPHLGLDAGSKKLAVVAPALHTADYRHRLKLPVHVTADRAVIGLYDPDTGRVLDTPDCPVLEAGLREALPPILAWMRGRHGIHSLDLRRSSKNGEMQAIFACEGSDLHGGPKGCRDLMNRVPGLVSVAVSRADPQRKRVIGDAPRVLAGKAQLVEAIGDTEMSIHPGAFFQVDPRNAVQIHDRVRAMVGDARRILDLYSGVGAYALMLAKNADYVLAVEESPAAVRSARAMAPKNLEVVESRVEDLALDAPFDVAILNPARRGSDPKTLATLARLAPRLVYVSCGPETLARDLDILAAHGMRVAEVAPIDLFPQTPEVETVVRLERGAALETFPVSSASGKQAVRAFGPWLSDWSGAGGRPERVLALVLGDSGDFGKLPRGRFKRIARIATHSLIRIDLEGPLVPALAQLARDGHAVAGRDRKTARFFAEKVGLVRPFVHVEATSLGRAPLHGDLVQALIGLGADDGLLARAGAGGEA